MVLVVVRGGEETRSREVGRVRLVVGVGARSGQIRGRQTENLLDGEGRRAAARRDLLRIRMVMMMVHLLLMMSQIHDTMSWKNVKKSINY